MFTLDRGDLLELASRHAAEYAAATPFPHVVIDNVFPDAVLEDVIAEYPGREGGAWIQFDSERERKLASTRDTPLGERTRGFLAELNSAAFIDFLEALTSITGLVPDPHLEGGGLHQLEPGGHLDIHIDFNRHPRLRLDRRLNALIYLNHDWQPEWGGGLELWSRDMQRCEQRIVPVFNRLVVFSTTEHSYHGNPQPVAGPPDRSRRSVALYYYSAGRPEERQEAAAEHNTLWATPGERPIPVGPRAQAKKVARQLTPPIVVDALKASRRRTRDT